MPRHVAKSPKKQSRKTLAETLSDILTARRLTSLEVSQAAGLSPEGLRNILRGKTAAPRASTLQKIADALDIPASDLLAVFAGPDAAPSPSSTSRWVEVPEIDIRPPPDGSPPDSDLPGNRIPLGFWRMPEDLLETHGVWPPNAAVVRLYIYGAHPEYRTGDRILIDALPLHAPPRLGRVIVFDQGQHSAAEVYRIGKRDVLRTLDRDPVSKSAKIVGRIIAKMLGT
jgi:transcriptional regulator with XRE-family HTH domain